MESLGVRCKTCGEPFKTGVVVGACGFPRLGAVERRCPSCRSVASYDSDDWILLRRGVTGSTA